ncbi:MAG: VCBS repeat-containing protein [Polyangiaceae bacterium]|nr:VCBS repeat-containing protein [Polyangiaceae bacterium]
MSNQHFPKAIQPRLPRSTTRVYRASLLSLMVLASACAGSETPEDGTDIATAQAPLVDESNVNPVVVTSGTCKSKGFKPILTQAGCDQAATILFADRPSTEGQLDTPAAVDSSGNLIDQTPPLGCTAGTRAPATEGDPSALITYFPSPTSDPAALNAQKCTHDRPCVCNDLGPAPEAPQISACRDGVFQPDPNKYYTIKSPNGRYMRTVADGEFGDSSTVMYTRIQGDALQPYSSRNLEDISTPSDVRFHWRFTETDAGYQSISRGTGNAMQVNRAINQISVKPVSDVVPPTFSCRGSQVVIEQSGLYPVDSGGLFRDSNRAVITTPPIVRVKRLTPGIMIRKTPCMSKSKSCESEFGPDFNDNTTRELCGFLNTKHELTCTSFIDVPVSMQVPQTWYVEEVHDFQRAVSFDVAPVTVAPLTSTSATGDALSTFGLSTARNLGPAAAETAISISQKLAGSAPMVGGVVSLGLGFLPGGEFDFNKPDPVADLAATVQVALEQLAQDVEVQTKLLVENALAEENAQQLSDTIKSNREDFWKDYGQNQRPLIFSPTASPSRLADILLEQGTRYDGDLDTLFPDICAADSADCQPSVLDLKQAHFAFNLVKLAIPEAMLILSEGALMDVLGNEGSCDDAIQFFSIDDHAKKYARLLQNAVDALVRYGRLSSANRLSASADEFEFDARNFSYDIKPQLAFLNKILADTKSKCRKLRDPNSTFRQHFIDNTPMPLECHGDLASGDSDGSGTCTNVVEAMASPWTPVATAGSNTGATDPILQDVDGDGDLDVVTRHLNERRITWWTNADGVLAEGFVLSPQVKPIGLDLADFDGDGDLDLAVGGINSGLQGFLTATNTGTAFEGPQFLDSAPKFGNVLAIHVDSDARPDLVAYDHNNNQLVLQLNTSDGSGVEFAPATIIDNVASNAFAGAGLAAADMDGDGDLDLVVATGKLAVYKNEGGSFLAPQTIDTVDIGSSIYAADIDGDGDVDILGRFNGRVVYYESFGIDNVGDLRFDVQKDVAAISANAFTVGDLDGDGDSDVLLRDANTGELIWVQNGDRGFVVRNSIGVTQGSFAIGDVDGDGDADVVATDPATNGLVTFSNPLR